MDTPPAPSTKPKTGRNLSRAKKETAVKKETRSRHEKKRREEMNEVINEMMELLPEDLGSMKTKKMDQKPRQPDKCFIIGSSVEMIKNSDYVPSLLSEPMTLDAFNLTHSFLIFLNNFIISEVEGDHSPIFDIEKNRMLGKDIRCFLDFESGSKLSFLDPNQLIHQLQLRSFMAKAMQCRMKTSEQNPSDAILVCVPDELAKIQAPPPLRLQSTPTFAQITPPKSPPPSKMEEERPILAALLRRKEPSQPRTTPPSTSTFLSPSSSNCSTVPKPTVTRKITVPQGPQKRKRLRSVNVIVETFPLDEKAGEETPPKKTRKRQSAPTTTTVTTCSTNTVPLVTPSVIHPIATHGMNPFDVLAPGYRDIWLRLQSETLLLKEKISNKQDELKDLMHLVNTPPPLINFPQYLLPQAHLSAQNQ